MKSFVMRSVVLKYRAIVWIILSEFISAGMRSTIASGSPDDNGSRKRSSVARYLTLSFDSFAASVIDTSICFHCRTSASTRCRSMSTSSGCLVTVVSIAITDLHCFVLS